MKKILIISLLMIVCLTGCGKKTFDIKTDKITINVGQKYDINDYLEYSDSNLKNIKVKVVEDNIDITKPGNYTIKAEVEAEDTEGNKNIYDIDVKRDSFDLKKK